MKNVAALSSIFFLTVLTKIGWACSICFYGSAKNSANAALRMGVLTLLVIVLGVLLAFIKFFLNTRKRAHLISGE